MYSCFLTPSITDCSDVCVSTWLPSPFWVPQILQPRPPRLLACCRAGRGRHHTLLPTLLSLHTPHIIPALFFANPPPTPGARDALREAPKSSSKHQIGRCT